MAAGASSDSRGSRLRLNSSAPPARVLVPSPCYMGINSRCSADRPMSTSVPLVSAPVALAYNALRLRESPASADASDSVERLCAASCGLQMRLHYLLPGKALAALPRPDIQQFMQRCRKGQVFDDLRVTSWQAEEASRARVNQLGSSPILVSELVVTSYIIHLNHGSTSLWRLFLLQGSIFALYIREDPRSSVVRFPSSFLDDVGLARRLPLQLGCLLSRHNLPSRLPSSLCEAP